MVSDLNRILIIAKQNSQKEILAQIGFCNLPTKEFLAFREWIYLTKIKTKTKKPSPLAINQRKR